MFTPSLVLAYWICGSMAQPFYDIRTLRPESWRACDASVHLLLFEGNQSSRRLSGIVACVSMIQDLPPTHLVHPHRVLEALGDEIPPVSEEEAFGGAEAAPGAIGARLTGGGFGGRTVNLVEAAQAQRFGEAVVSQYRQRTGLDGQAHVCRALAGMQVCDA
jgi:hypothetical protein